MPKNLTRDEFKTLIRTTPFVHLGNKFNVSDKTICKWCKKFNLPDTRHKINTYSDEEWKTL